MRFFGKVDEHIVFKFLPAQLIAAVVGLAIFVILVFVTGVAVGRSLFTHPAVSILQGQADQGVKPMPDPEQAVTPKPHTYVTDSKTPIGVVSVPGDVQSREYDMQGSPTPVVPTVQPEPVAPPAPPQEAHAAPAEALPAATAPAKTAKTPLPPRTATTVTTVAPPPPPKTTAQPTAAANGKQSFALQIESYQEKGKADAARKKLAARGVNTEISMSQVNGVNWYRLQASGFSTREAAEKYNKEVLKPKGLTGYLISK